MKHLLIITFIALITVAGCKKPATEQPPSGTEAQVLSDFATVLANPNYQDLRDKANLLNQAILTLSATPTEANLQAAQVAWRNTRTSWELSEGYLFGPIEDFNYDPSIDTWPLNKTDLDSLLASNNTLTVANIDSLPFSLKGFHAIEYVIFGSGSSRVVSQITSRQMQYVLSLSQSVYNTAVSLANSWDAAHGNFTAEVVNAGQGSTRFITRKAAFLAIVGAMSDICNEVANGKMQDPYAASDSTLDESAFSHNTTADYKNNITGVLNTYLCKFNGIQGHGMNQLVAASNISLDNTIQSQMNAAINSFSAINVTFEQAIYTQRTQIKNAQDAINTLKSTLDNDLTTWVNTNIKD